MAEKLKSQLAIVLACFGMGAVVSALVGARFSHLIWWAYPLITLAVGLFLYKAVLDITAKRRLVDRDHKPK